jgi:hypothetical protein
MQPIDPDCAAVPKSPRSAAPDIVLALLDGLVPQQGSDVA